MVLWWYLIEPRGPTRGWQRLIGVRALVHPILALRESLAREGEWRSCSRPFFCPAAAAVPDSDWTAQCRLHPRWSGESLDLEGFRPPPASVHAQTAWAYINWHKTVPRRSQGHRLPERGCSSHRGCGWWCNHYPASGIWGTPGPHHGAEEGASQGPNSCSTQESATGIFRKVYVAPLYTGHRFNWMSELLYRFRGKVNACSFSMDSTKLDPTVRT